MTRKVFTLIAATLLIVGLLPVGIASAQANGQAALTQGIDIFPGTETFTFSVRNNETALVGRSINFVRFIPPSNAGFSTTTLDGVVAPEGWTASVVGPSSSRRIQFTGGSLNPGQTATFGFRGDVARPLDSDKTGTWKVELSSDNGQTISGASTAAGGTLTTLVRILEVTRVAPVSPTGVTDGTGTANQNTTWEVDVVNHAQNAVPVTPSLTSNGNETIGQPTPTSGDVAGNDGAGTFTFPVQLGNVSSDVNRIFTGDASAPGADGRALVRAFTVQAPPILNLDATTFQPTHVQPSDPDRPVFESFSIRAAKSGSPALSLTLTNADGTDAARLNFASTTADLSEAVNFGSGSVTGDNRPTLTFGSAEVLGEDGTYDAVFTLYGVDGNDAPFQATISRDDLVTIDGIAPVIDNLRDTLPMDGDPNFPRRQEAVKNGDTVTIEGDIDEPDAQLEILELRASDADSTATYTQEIPLSSVNRTSTGFNATVEIDMPFAIGGYVIYAQARDLAQNQGEEESVEATPIDQVVPALADGFTSRGANDRIDRIVVRFGDLPADESVFSGCSANQYRVAEQLLVTNVTNLDGSECVEGQQGTDNFRVLHLAQTFDRDDTPFVTYTPGGDPLTGESVGVGDRVKDQAGNFADQATITPIDGIIPPPPDILDVTRNNGTEEATFDEDRYWTRFGGTDLRVEFAGGRAGYQLRIEVTDPSGTTTTTDVAVNGSPDTTQVTLGTTEGDYQVRLALIDGAGNLGEFASITVALDQTAPQVLDAVRNATGDEVTVNFSEKLASGRNFASDWFAFENHSDGRHYLFVNSVSGSGATRILDVEPEDPSTTVGAEYVYGGAPENRYVDRAGNALADHEV